MNITTKAMKVKQAYDDAAWDTHSEGRYPVI